MPITTFLHEAELNQPTGDAELDDLLAEARSLTGRNYQVVTHRAIERHGFFGLRTRIVIRTCLYLEVGGIGPWQWLSSMQTVETVRAYLLGLINGCNKRHAANTSSQ